MGMFCLCGYVEKSCGICGAGDECLAGNGDDDFFLATKEQIIERLDRDQYKNHRDIMIKTLKEKFKTREYADIFSKKTQFIADLLHFKYLYDRDYEPNWDSEYEQKFYVYYNNKTKKFEYTYSSYYTRFESVYFSTGELAQKCVDWLNKKYN